MFKINPIYLKLLCEQDVLYVTQGTKEYRDIGLLANGPFESVYGTISDLRAAAERTETSFPRVAPDGLEYTAQVIDRRSVYVGTTIQERYEITVGETVINVGLRIQ